MNLNRGHLYFLGEENTQDGTLTPLVKIGIIRESEKRTSEKRAQEHQTGNPRRLRLLHDLPSPTVERIETLLHTQFAPRRVGGEWFYLPEAELLEVVESAKARIDEAKTNASDLGAAQRLEKAMSNGKSLDPDESLNNLHLRLLDVRKQLSEIKEAEKRLEAAIRQIQSEVPDLLRCIVERSQQPRRSFDESAFSSAHPGIAAEFTVEKTKSKKRFILNGTRSHPSTTATDNPGLHAHLGAIDKLTTTGRDAEVLHGSFLATLALRGPLDWERDLLQAQLKAACGENERITDVCTWVRTTTTVPVLDTEALKTSQPDLYEQYSREEAAATTFVIARDLGYRLPDNF